MRFDIFVVNIKLLLCCCDSNVDKLTMWAGKHCPILFLNNPEQVDHFLCVGLHDVSLFHELVPFHVKITSC